MGTLHHLMSTPPNVRRTQRPAETPLQGDEADDFNMRSPDLAAGLQQLLQPAPRSEQPVKTSTGLQSATLKQKRPSSMKAFKARGPRTRGTQDRMEDEEGQEDSSFADCPSQEDVRRLEMESR